MLAIVSLTLWALLFLGVLTAIFTDTKNPE